MNSKVALVAGCLFLFTIVGDTNADNEFKTVPKLYEEIGCTEVSDNSGSTRWVTFQLIRLIVHIVWRHSLFSYYKSAIMFCWCVFFLSSQCTLVFNALTLTSMITTNVIWMANHSKLEMNLQKMMPHFAVRLVDAYNMKVKLLTFNAPTSIAQKTINFSTPILYRSTMIWSNAVDRAKLPVNFNPFYFRFHFFLEW